MTNEEVEKNRLLQAFGCSYPAFKPLLSRAPTVTVSGEEVIATSMEILSEVNTAHEQRHTGDMELCSKLLQTKSILLKLIALSFLVNVLLTVGVWVCR